LLASVSQPLLALKGFQKISLQPGETKDVSFEISPDMLKILNKDMNWEVEPGDFRILIGASSKDIRLRDNITVVGE
jgi:beta-glucosidase